MWELDYVMRGLKGQSWCKIRKESTLLGRSTGAVPFLMAHRVSWNVNIVYFKSKTTLCQIKRKHFWPVLQFHQVVVLSHLK